MWHVSSRSGVATLQTAIRLLLSYLLTVTKTRDPNACSALVRLTNTLLKDGETAPDNHVLACNFAKYSPIFKMFSLRLSNKPFLIWLLTTRPHREYVATLPCNLSLLSLLLLTLMFHKVV